MVYTIPPIGDNKNVEKRTPHYDLRLVKAAVKSRGDGAFTRTAIDNGDAMGLTVADMIETVCALSRRDFHKSMTSHASSQI